MCLRTDTNDLHFKRTNLEGLNKPPHFGSPPCHFSSTLTRPGTLLVQFKNESVHFENELIQSGIELVHTENEIVHFKTPHFHSKYKVIQF